MATEGSDVDAGEDGYSKWEVMRGDGYDKYADGDADADDDP